MELQVTAAKLSGDPERDVKTLSNHVFQLEEQLRYTLRNLDVTNFNDLGLARYENGRLQFYAEQVKIQTDALRVELGKETEEIYAKIDATTESLSTEIKALGGNYSSLTQTVNGIKTTVKSHSDTLDTHTSQITQTSNQISAVITSVGENGEVTAASIVAAIVGDASSISLLADNIVLSADYVTITDLKTSGATVINGDNIKTGEIIGINFIAAGDITDGSTSNSFVVLNALGYQIGKIGYAWVQEDTNNEKLYLMTEEYWDGYYTYKPALKLKGAGGVSIETDFGYNPVYIAAPGGYVTIDAPHVYIRDNWDTEWTFKDGGLYKNGTQVL